MRHARATSATWAINDHFLDAEIQHEAQHTAFHEAGHAVFHVLFGIPFGRVEIFTDANPEPPGMDGYAGIVHCDYFTDWPAWAIPECHYWDPERAYRHVDALICILHAGAVAESIYAGRKAETFVGRYDRGNIRFICQSLLGMTAAATRERSARLAVAMRAMLQTPAVWRAVSAVAGELLRRNVLTPADVRVLVNRCDLALWTGKSPVNVLCE